MIEMIKSVDLEMLLRLFIAALLGLAIGIERELKRKSLGLRTILVISTISCLLTIVSIQSSYQFQASEFTEIRMDPLRLAAQIVSGVGFLGAGVILRRGDDTISGLTTAALVWGAAGIGIAVGAGFYIEAVVGVMILLFTVEFLPGLINRIDVKELHVKELFLKVKVKDRNMIGGVIEQVEKSVIRVDNIRIKDMDSNACVVILLIIIDDTQSVTDIYNEVAMVEAIEQVEIRA